MEVLKVANTDPMTLSKHLLKTQQACKIAHGDFTQLMQSISTACKFISHKVRKAGIANLYGLAGGENQTGDEQKKLDVISNDVFINVMKSSGKCCILASEEEEQAFIIDDPEANYVCAFDPLDGSSNIDVCVSIGSIFGIWKRKSDGLAQESDLLQKGTDMVAAGYCLYGSSTQLVLTIGGKELYGYTLDPSLGEFILTHDLMKFPEKPKLIYSINEGNAALWDKAITTYVERKKFPTEGKKAYSARYVGSMVADIHRTIIYGGCFLYPKDSKTKSGKLRILYEAFPMAYIIEAAGGLASTGINRILEIQPEKVHERCPCILGSVEEVNEVISLYQEFNCY